MVMPKLTFKNLEKLSKRNWQHPSQSSSDAQSSKLKRQWEAHKWRRRTGAFQKSDCNQPHGWVKRVQGMVISQINRGHHLMSIMAHNQHRFWNKIGRREDPKQLWDLVLYITLPEAPRIRESLKALALVLIRLRTRLEYQWIRYRNNNMYNSKAHNKGRGSRMIFQPVIHRNNRSAPLQRGVVTAHRGVTNYCHQRKIKTLDIWDKMNVEGQAP